MFLTSGGDQLGHIASQVEPDGEEIGNYDELVDACVDGLGHRPGKVGLTAVKECRSNILVGPGSFNVCGKLSYSDVGFLHRAAMRE